MLEDDLAAQQQVKLGFFKFKEKRVAQENLQRTTKELSAAKNELEVKLETFKAEQDKLHDNYQLQKQQLSQESDRLHKELEKLETDTSTEPRQKACNALTQSINAMVSRLPAT
jgi:cytochrome c556